MMTTRSVYQERAASILKLIQDEKIVSDQDKLVEKRFDVLRGVVRHYAESPGIIAPALTACVATTFLKVGLCQEFSQRFVLEYCLKYKAQDVSLVFTSNPVLGPKPSDHAFVILGPVNAPDDLFTGGAASGCNIKPKEVNQKLSDFLEANKDSVMVDPLINCMGNLNDGLAPLLRFFNNYQITHVVGIRSYHQTPSFIESASTIKANAIAIADKTKLTLSTMTDAKLSHLATALFNHLDVNSLVKKYKLSDASQASLEKALRVAVNNNMLEDVKALIKIVKNINAQDANPNQQRTALHWAAIKGHHECYQLLLDAGAKPDILDAAAKAASVYKKEFNAPTITK